MAKRILLDPQIVDILGNEMQSLLKEAISQNRIEDFKTVLKSLLNK